MRAAFAIALALGALAGCQTEFVGSAHITPAACEAKCTAIHMTVGGMVFMGEYSSACVCQASPTPGAPPAPGTPPPAATPAPDPAVPIATAAVGEAAAGVIMQQQQRDSRTDYVGPKRP